MTNASNIAALKTALAHATTLVNSLVAGEVTQAEITATQAAVCSPVLDPAYALVVDPVVTPPAPTPAPQPTPAPSITALVGNWNNGANIGIPSAVYSTYADGPSYTTYSFESGAKGKQLSLAVGPMTTAQATTLAQELIANGAANAWIRPDWEMNQHTWFPLWNEQDMTMAQFKSTWQSLVNAMRAVSGQKFKFIWCVNAGDSNNAQGRTSTDTFPGTAYVDQVGIDCYDEFGTVAAAQANIGEMITFAKTQNLPWQLSEVGPANGNDNAAFVTMISTLSKDGTCAAVVFFGGVASGPGTKFGPNWLAAIKSNFA